MRLKDKVILITGSTRGIGQSMAQIFASEGAAVMIHGTYQNLADDLVQDLQHRGAKATSVIADLRLPESPEHIIKRTVEYFGRIDGLVNNAALCTRSNLETTDSKLFEDLFAINLRAPLFLIQAALPHFRKQGSGRVLNIGSVNAYGGEKNLLAYSMTKGGLMTLTRNLADSYGREGIRVNQLNVGWTLTANEYEFKKKEGLPDDWPSKLPESFIPSGRLLSPEEVAWAAVYFLSDEAGIVNGSILDFEQYPLIGRNPEKCLK